MLKFVQRYRRFCSSIAKNEQIIDFDVVVKRVPVDFQKINHVTKVPQKPQPTNFSDSPANSLEIDNSTIQLLERLSLVDLDSKEALETLKSSILFADKITHIDTGDVAPLYTVLEQHNLPLRADQVTDGNCRQAVLSNAKITDEDYFVSPPGNIPLMQENKLEDL